MLAQSRTRYVHTVSYAVRTHGLVRGTYTRSRTRYVHTVSYAVRTHGLVRGALLKLVHIKSFMADGGRWSCKFVSDKFNIVTSNMGHFPQIVRLS